MEENKKWTIGVIGPCKPHITLSQVIEEYRKKHKEFNETDPITEIAKNIHFEKKESHEED